MRNAAMNRNFGTVGGLSLMGLDVGAGINTDDATAAAADILSGRIAYAKGKKITGTMPNRAGETPALFSKVSGTTLKLLASQGYRDGVDDYVTITDPNFLSKYIRNGISLFGLVGSSGVNPVGNNQVFSYYNGATTLSTVYVKLLSFTINVPGTYRIRFTLASGSDGTPVFARIYKNGIPYGTERTTTQPPTGVPFVEDLFFESNDTCEFWAKTSNASYTAQILNISFMIGSPVTITP